VPGGVWGRGQAAEPGGDPEPRRPVRPPGGPQRGGRSPRPGVPRLQRPRRVRPRHRFWSAARGQAPAQRRREAPRPAGAAGRSGPQPRTARDRCLAPPRRRKVPERARVADLLPPQARAPGDQAPVRRWRVARSLRTARRPAGLTL